MDRCVWSHHLWWQISCLKMIYATIFQPELVQKCNNLFCNWPNLSLQPGREQWETYHSGWSEYRIWRKDKFKVRKPWSEFGQFFENTFLSGNRQVPLQKLMIRNQPVYSQTFSSSYLPVMNKLKVTEMYQISSLSHQLSFSLLALSFLLFLRRGGEEKTGFLVFA